MGRVKQGANVNNKTVLGIPLLRRVPRYVSLFIRVLQLIYVALVPGGAVSSAYVRNFARWFIGLEVLLISMNHGGLSHVIGLRFVIRMSWEALVSATR